MCQNNGNLLVSGGRGPNIEIFDKRESKIIKTFDAHSGNKLNLFKQRFNV